MASDVSDDVAADLMDDVAADDMVTRLLTSSVTFLLTSSCSNGHRIVFEIDTKFASDGHKYTITLVTEVQKSLTG